MDATCKTCPFWNATPEDRADCGARECRVRSPAAYTKAMATHPPPRDAQWPWTEPGHWCGEHPLRQRDRVAAMAMQGLLADPAVALSTDETRASLARLAYHVADAMLAASAPDPQEK